MQIDIIIHLNKELAKRLVYTVRNVSMNSVSCSLNHSGRIGLPFGIRSSSSVSRVQASKAKTIAYTRGGQNTARETILCGLNSILTVQLTGMCLI